MHRVSLCGLLCTCLLVACGGEDDPALQEGGRELRLTCATGFLSQTVLFDEGETRGQLGVPAFQSLGEAPTFAAVRRSRDVIFARVRSDGREHTRCLYDEALGTDHCEGELENCEFTAVEGPDLDLLDAITAGAYIGSRSQ